MKCLLVLLSIFAIQCSTARAEEPEIVRYTLSSECVVSVEIATKSYLDTRNMTIVLTDEEGLKFYNFTQQHIDKSLKIETPAGAFVFEANIVTPLSSHFVIRHSHDEESLRQAKQAKESLENSIGECGEKPQPQKIELSN